jgi:hypothetical protein
MRNSSMPRTWNRARTASLSLSALILLAAAGCGNGVSTAPSKEIARSALETALKSWKEGGMPGELPGTGNPKVEVHDTHWSQGDALESFEILGEDEAAGEKRFSVRLSLSKPKQTDEVQYHVLGLDPVMVFRDEDYERNINMENGPSTSKAGRRKGGASRQ